MKAEEFSNNFDVLYNSITSNQAPSLDEYEKSIFLTEAQYEILLSYFDPRKNKIQEGYDGSQRRQIDFSKITISVSYKNEDKDENKDGDKPDTQSDDESNDESNNETDNESKFVEALFDPRDDSVGIIMPSDIMMMLNERLTVTRGTKSVFLTVIPLQYSEYDRLMSKPYKRPVKNQAWRVFNYDINSKNTADLVVGPGDAIKEYTFRYVRRPKPIVTGNLDGLEIEGCSDVTECELDPIIHYEILQRAVEKAKAAYTGNLQDMVSLGQNSQTEIGVLTQSR